MKLFFILISLLSVSGYSNDATDIIQDHLSVPIKVTSLVLPGSEVGPEIGIEPFFMGNLRADFTVLTATVMTNMDFGSGIGGDAAAVLAPESQGSAQLVVSAGMAAKGREIEVKLPPGVEMLSECSCGSIVAEQFTMFSPNEIKPSLDQWVSPYAYRRLKLDHTGQAALYVGATREALPPNLKADRYSGKAFIDIRFAD